MEPILTSWSIHCCSLIRWSDVRLNIDITPRQLSLPFGGWLRSISRQDTSHLNDRRGKSFISLLVNVSQIYLQLEQLWQEYNSNPQARVSYHGTNRRLIGEISLSSDRGKKRNGKREKSRDKVTHVEIIVDHWLGDFTWCFCLFLLFFSSFFFIYSCCCLVCCHWNNWFLKRLVHPKVKHHHLFTVISLQTFKVDLCTIFIFIQ